MYDSVMPLDQLSVVSAKEERGYAGNIFILVGGADSGSDFREIY
jgi:hypothetical protein